MSKLVADWIAKIALLLGTTALCLLLGELVIRLLGWAPDVWLLMAPTSKTVYQRSDNPILGFELKAGYHDDSADLSTSYPSTNAFGQRDIERSIARAPGVRRTILLGDSVVEGHRIRNLDDTMSRQMERLFPDGSMEVLNFGVSGYCTLAEVELLRVKGLQLAPDTAILVFVENDFNNFNKEVLHLEGGTRRPALVSHLFRRSHLFRLLCLRLDLFGYRAETDPVAWNRRAIGDNNVVAGLAMLRELSLREGFEVLIGAWPTFDDQSIIDRPLVPGEGRGLVIEDLARSYGLPVFRFSEAFAAARPVSEQEWNPRLLFTVGDGVHPSPHGCAVAARALAQRVMAGLPSPPAPLDGNEAAQATAAAQDLGGEPTYARLHSNLGVELRDQGRLPEAIAEFRRAVEEEPDFAEGWSNLGSALLEQGRTDEAVAHLRRALELKPGRPELHYNLGRALEARHELEAALEQYRQAVHIYPGYDAARRAVARAQAGLSSRTR